MRTYFSVILVFCGLCLNAQHKVVYHRFEETASDPNLSEWEISPDLETDSYIVEEIDESNRVLSLIFMIGADPYPFTVEGTYGYEFQYPSPNRIIARPKRIEYSDESSEEVLETIEYFLEDSLKIEKCIYKYRNQQTEAVPNNIIGYIYSVTRFNGKFPTGGKNINWYHVYFPYEDGLFIDKRYATRNIELLPEIGSSVLSNYSFEQQNYDYSTGGLTIPVELSVSSTSELSSQGINSYSANNLIDLSLATAWIEGRENFGINELINFRFSQPNHPTRRGFKIYTVVLANGYCKNEAVWKVNSRIKKLKIYHQNRPLCYVNMSDTMSPQQIDFESLLNPKHMWSSLDLQFEIIEVYPGTKYKDTAISEIAFYRYVDYVGKE